MTAAPTRSARNRHLISEAVVPLAALVYIVAFLVSTRGLPPESTVFPRTILTVLGLLGLMVLAAEARIGPSETTGFEPRAYVIFALSVLFVIVIGLTGYLVAAMLFLLIAMLYLKQRWIVAVPVAVLLPAVTYSLFIFGFGVAL